MNGHDESTGEYLPVRHDGWAFAPSSLNRSRLIEIETRSRLYLCLHHARRARRANDPDRKRVHDLLRRVERRRLVAIRIGRVRQHEIVSGGFDPRSVLLRPTTLRLESLREANRLDGMEVDRLLVQLGDRPSAASLLATAP